MRAPGFLPFAVVTSFPVCSAMMFRCHKNAFQFLVDSTTKKFLLLDIHLKNPCLECKWQQMIKTVMKVVKTYPASYS